MDDEERKYKVVLAWAIRRGLATQYENLDRALTKYELLRILYRLFNECIGGKNEIFTVK